MSLETSIMTSGALGPPCTHCGCNDTLVVREPELHEWFDSGLARCNECGGVFSFSAVAEDEPKHPNAVAYVAVHCPACNSDDCPITSTRRPIRLHRCRTCGETFKSVERKTNDVPKIQD